MKAWKSILLAGCIILLLSSGCLKEDESEDDGKKKIDMENGPKKNMTFIIHNLDPDEVDHRFKVYFDDELKVDSSVPYTNGTSVYSDLYGFTISLPEGIHNIKAEVPEKNSGRSTEIASADDVLYFIQYGLVTNPDVNIAYVGSNMSVSGFNQLPVLD
jgi:hypothetical protein